MGYESQGSAVMTREENRRPDNLGTWEPCWEICESFKGQWEPGKGQKKEVVYEKIGMLEKPKACFRSWQSVSLSSVILGKDFFLFSFFFLLKCSFTHYPVTVPRFPFGQHPLTALSTVGKHVQG